VDQIIFWDDSLANVDAARAHGWQAELYTDYATFYEQFRQAIA
jgi:FMN phosphatase YigB (HAD superfamily)